MRRLRQQERDSRAQAQDSASTSTAWPASEYISFPRIDPGIIGTLTDTVRRRAVRNRGDPSSQPSTSRSAPEPVRAIRLERSPPRAAIDYPVSIISERASALRRNTARQALIRARISRSQLGENCSVCGEPRSGPPSPTMQMNLPPLPSFPVTIPEDDPIMHFTNMHMCVHFVVISSFFVVLMVGGSVQLFYYFFDS